MAFHVRVLRPEHSTRVYETLASRLLRRFISAFLARNLFRDCLDALSARRSSSMCITCSPILRENHEDVIWTGVNSTYGLMMWVQLFSAAWISFFSRRST